MPGGWRLLAALGGIAAVMPAAADMPMPGVPDSVAGWAVGAMPFDGLGGFHRKVTTNSAEAQDYFDQGMRLLWAFNHDEATRSFAKAAALDPTCALCYWGVALTVGPNYNLTEIADPRGTVAREAAASARRAEPGATPVERALIEAVARRYPDGGGLALDAYADAMRQVAHAYPDDLDVQTLFAEAEMNLRPWRLWTADGRPAPGTPEVVATLEAVLRRDPGHPGANHYYIHAVEASPHPERAIRSAERLTDMMPAAGHMEHMPAHIFQRVGRYDEAASANLRGAAADEAYFAETRPIDYYPMYTGHNYHFLGYSAAMEGCQAETLDAFRKLGETIPADKLAAMPSAGWSVGQIYFAYVRFGLWDRMLAEPAPDPKVIGLSAAYLFGRGMALAATGRIDEAKAALTALQALSPGDIGVGSNSLHDVMAIAIPVVDARIATAEHRDGDAIQALTAAAALEDQLGYDEPRGWFLPVRHLLGAELLKTGKPAAAEAVYRADLVANPANGWALRGLELALAAEGKDSSEAARRYRAAWAHADIQLAGSAF
jgi:tetratricopeptide (TPR) repeat protein